MRLLFTGRVVRASRKTLISPIQPRRWNSTNEAAAEDPQTPSIPVIRPVRQGYRTNRSLPTIDINPQDFQPATLVEGSFKAFLLDQEEPNKIFGRDRESGVVISSRPYELDSSSNLSPNILKLLDRRLYAHPDHPIGITKKLIESVFPQPTYQHYIASNPVVTTTANFDMLGFPKDHPGRSTTDTYYVNKDKVLRTHTSAHQHAAFQAMAKPETAYGYTICADVFRRDSIDRSHFPVFHQMEGARLWRLSRTDSDGFPLSQFKAMNRRVDIIRASLKELGRPPVDAEDPNPAFDSERNPQQPEHYHQEVRLLAAHLKRSLETLVAKIFDAAKKAGIESGHLNANVADERLKVRWVEAYFPFTSPSWELEVLWQGEWLELLGCGIVQQKILRNAGVGDKIGWAWGLGVERLAMILFGIPDIRLFWSEDPRFLAQFQADKVTRFEPFSKFPACYKDTAFWIDASPGPAPLSPLSEHILATTNSNSESGAGVGVAAPAGGDATKASPTEAQPAAFHENDVMEIVRDVAGSLAEDVKLVDEFVHPTSGRKSLCYRVNYRSLERTLTNEEVNGLHEELGKRLVRDLGVELR
jgi:phenylalanyl-tRNA synthetase alpha chain